MTRRLIWLVLLALLLTPLLGAIGPSQAARALDDVSTEATVEPAPTDGTSPNADTTDEATSTPDATETITPDATDVPTATDEPTDAATETPTDAATPEVTGTPSESATETPSAAASPSPSATGTVKAAELLGSTDDISIILKCTTSEELIRVTNNGAANISLLSIGTLADQLAIEPFALTRVLKPGTTAIFSAGADAVHGTPLTTRYIFTNSKYDQDGVSLDTSVGTVEQTCPAKPAPVDPAVSNPGSLSDLSVTLDCRSYAETIKVTNNGTGYVRVKALATDYAPLAAEPFHVDVLLRPGKTSIFQAGDGAKYGTILTTRYIFTNSVWDQDGIRISTTAGKLRKSCDAKPVPPEHWVEVNLSLQYLWAYEGDTVVNETYVSTGVPGLETPTGTFYVLVKYLTDDMEGVINGQYYFVPQVPWVQYFTNEGHALHGAYWHNNFGHPMSHGCVNLPLDFAEWLYYWLPYGGRIEIHY